MGLRSTKPDGTGGGEPPYPIKINREANMINKILYILCSEEVKLILKRMDERPNDFTHFQTAITLSRPSMDPSQFTLTSPPSSHSPNESDRRWRMLVETGIFTKYESYVLRRRLRQLDIRATHQKVYEVLFK